MFPRRVALSAILLASVLSAVACTPKIPFLQTTQQSGVSAPVAVTPPPATIATKPAATPPPAAVIVRVSNDPTPRPPHDAVLGTRHWGIRSSTVKGARSPDQVTSDLHSTVEGFENDQLTAQQSEELLCIFRHSKGVRRLIEADGGDPCDATFWVKQVSANEDDIGNRTAWVTATLRADYPAPEGQRAIEMQVYRQKTRDGRLDNTPYIASTQAGWIGSTGDLVGTDGPNGSTDELIKNIRFTN